MKTTHITVISGGQGAGKSRLAKRLSAHLSTITVYAESIRRLTDLTTPASKCECLIVEGGVDIKQLIAWAKLASESCSLIITTQYPATSADLGVRVLTFT